MCLLKKATKGAPATGVGLWLFWSSRSPLTSALQMKQQVVRSHCGCFIPAYEPILQSLTSKANSIICKRCNVWFCVCVCVTGYVCWGAPCDLHSLPADGGLKNLQTGVQPGHFGLPSRLGRTHTHMHARTRAHTVGHFSVRLCDFSTHAIWVWQRMSGCLPAITHLRRENQPCPQKLDALIGARLEQGLQIRGTCSAFIVEAKRAYYSPGLTIQDSDHIERPFYRFLFKTKKERKKRAAAKQQRSHVKKSCTVQHVDTPRPPPHPPLSPDPSHS